MDVVCAMKTNNGSEIDFRLPKNSKFSPIFLLWPPLWHCQIGFGCNSSLLINKSGISQSLTCYQNDHRCGSALNANAVSSHQHENKAVLTGWVIGDRGHHYHCKACTVCAACQSRALALDRQPISASFTAMPQGCVRKTQKYAGLTILWKRREGGHGGGFNVLNYILRRKKIISTY